MKIKDAVILFLLLIICVQYIQSLLLVKRFDRLQFIFQDDPVKVYVAGLTETIMKADRLRLEITMQHRWLSRRLYKCIELLEQENGLEPIPMEYPKIRVGPYPRSHPNSMETYMSELPFYKPYKKRNISPFKDIRECGVKTLTAIVKNLQLAGQESSLERSRAEIKNYDKRLKRLEEHWNK